MTADLPKVSIGIGAYNHEPYLLACLESIREQTYPNIEVFISDDCSKDNTREVISEYACKNPDFFQNITFHEKNQGIAGNFNSLFAQMSGEYLCFFAGDDQMYPEKIERQVVALQGAPQASMCYSDVIWYDPVRDKNWFHHFGLLQKPPKDISDLIAENTLPSPSFLIRKSRMPSFGFDKRLPIINDYKLALDLFDVGALIYLEEALVKYCKHQNSITATNYFVSDRFKLHVILKKKYADKYAKALRRNKCVCGYALVMELIKRGHKKKALKLVAKLWPIFFTSVKWMGRSALILRKFLYG